MQKALNDKVVKLYSFKPKIFSTEWIKTIGWCFLTTPIVHNMVAHDDRLLLALDMQHLDLSSCLPNQVDSIHKGEYEHRKANRVENTTALLYLVFPNSSAEMKKLFRARISFLLKFSDHFSTSKDHSSQTF